MSGGSPSCPLCFSTEIALHLEAPVDAEGPARNFSRAAAFHDARRHWLRRLEELAVGHPGLRRERRAFAFHARIMRGIHGLEQQRPQEAVGELFHAV